MWPHNEKLFWMLVLVVMSIGDYFDWFDPSYLFREYATYLPYIVVIGLIFFWRYLEYKEVVPGLFDFRDGSPSAKYELGKFQYDENEEEDDD